MTQKRTVERWGRFEVTVEGPSGGNPFTEQWIRGCFCGKNETVNADGFYDGNGQYRVRFMPSFEGEYAYRIEAGFLKEPVTGTVQVLPADAENHGPVRVANTFHFAYEDGTPYYSVGTTCYVWALQSDERIRETLETLKNSAFNKIRFCIFPKHYDYNLGEPRSYPYEGTPMDSSVLTRENFWQFTGKAEGNDWDLERFHPEYFRHLEWCVEQLCACGIEADLIVMHPYDRWGFSCMTKEQDDLYWKMLSQDSPPTATSGGHWQMNMIFCERKHWRTGSGMRVSSVKKIRTAICVLFITADHFTITAGRG